ncbi:hypothetical protein GWI33_009445, partial [Rhynchophorus ferrugineus]
FGKVNLTITEVQQLLGNNEDDDLGEPNMIIIMLRFKFCGNKP